VIAGFLCKGHGGRRWVDGGVRSKARFGLWPVSCRSRTVEGFDRFAEDRFRPFFAGQMGRPSLPPTAYFRMLMICYFEGIDSERGMAWRVADSLALRPERTVERRSVVPPELTRLRHPPRQR